MAACAKTDWIRALQRTSEIRAGSTRTLSTVVDKRASERGEALAIVDETSSLTYAALAARTRFYARWALDQGLAPGDRVALMMENLVDYPTIWLGLSRVGVVTALLNTQLTGAGLAHCLCATGVRLAIASIGLAPNLINALGERSETKVWVHGGDLGTYPRIDTNSDALDGPFEANQQITLADPALLIYTSGTTGLPKAAHISHFRIMMWSEWFSGMMDVCADDRLYDCLPMYHSVGGVVAVGAMLVSGGTVVLRRGFSASRFWADVEQSGATIFQYIGELCRFLTSAPDDGGTPRHSLRMCVGNGLRADVWRAFEARFAIPRIIEFYAATEGSFSLFNLEGEAGAIGRIPSFLAHRTPVALVEYDIELQGPRRDGNGYCCRCDVDETGEAIGLVTHQASLATNFEGYTDPEASERKLLRDVFVKGDLWFRTGDLMRKDRRGFFYFVDRIGDTFRWKGENVSTTEVADILLSCDGIVEASVYGVTVPETDGRAGMASLVADESFYIKALHAHCVANLPRFARPVFLRLQKALSITATFKTQKAEAREGYDPSKINDVLYYDDGKSYRLLHTKEFLLINSGLIRL